MAEMGFVQSWRAMRRSPWFAVTAVLTFALAIGANCVVFSVMRGLILRPLNVPQADSLYSIQRTRERFTIHSYPDYLDFRDRNHTFEDLIAYNIPQVALNTGDNPVPTWGLEASGNYFDALRIQPYLGRFFHASDEHGANSAPYLVLSYAFWRVHFHGNRGVLGRTVLVDKHPFTIIGVAPPSFQGTLVFYAPNFFVPLVNCEQVDGYNYLNDRGNRSLLQVMGHLKAGVSPSQATADLNSIGSRLEKQYRQDEGQMNVSLARPGLFGDQFVGSFRAFLSGLLVLAGLMLFAACANLGSLFAARAADRSKELALRLALGSSSFRLLLGLFSEAVLISLAGGVAGLWSSDLFLQRLSEWQPFGNFPVHAPVAPDAAVCAIALLLSLASGLLFGAVPVKQVLATDPNEVIKSGSSTRIDQRITTRDILLAVQIAICALLVMSSIVAIRGLVRSLHSRYGFEPRNAMLVAADLHMAGYAGDAVAPAQKRMLNVVAGIPGVESVGLSDPLLLNDSSASAVYSDRTTDLRAQNAAAQAYEYHVSPHYLRAEGTRLLSGRDFTWHDDKNSARVAIVSVQFARKIFGPVENAVGHYFKMPDGSRVQVVGIVEDGKYASLSEEPHPAMFLSILQWPSSTAYLVVRSSRDPKQLGPAIRIALHQLNPGLPVALETRYDEMVTALCPGQMATEILGAMGGLGAMLAITGMFGMAAYSVSRRLRELGIRVALGARRKEVLQAALGRALRLLAFGSAAGMVLGIAASRVLASIVYEATPGDPFVLAGVVLSMGVLGLVATWLPARRALSVDPMILVRQE
jgi:predicted permease